jgi:hypothetical protein
VARGRVYCRKEREKDSLPVGGELTGVTQESGGEPSDRDPQWLVVGDVAFEVGGVDATRVSRVVAEDVGDLDRFLSC